MIDIGIDLGSFNINVWAKGKGIVLSDSSVIATDRKTGRVAAIGSKALAMEGRAGKNVITAHPVKNGRLFLYEETVQLFRCVFEKASPRMVFHKPTVALCVPDRMSPVEKKALMDAALEAGAGDVVLTDAEIMAAIGAGLDVSRPIGSMVADIGGSVTDIAVISLGETVVCKSEKTGGNAFTESIKCFIKEKYGLDISDGEAERIKKHLGFGLFASEGMFAEAKGRLENGLPGTASVDMEKLAEALKEPAEKIADAVCGALKEASPELCADISERGIVLTGGGANLSGLAEIITNKSGLSAMVAASPASCAARGVGRTQETEKQKNARNYSRQRLAGEAEKGLLSAARGKGFEWVESIKTKKYSLSNPTGKEHA